jgi:hypothetical protein
VTDKGTATLLLLIGEDLTADPPKSLRYFGARQKRSLLLRVKVSGLTLRHDLQIQLNGAPLDFGHVSPTLSEQPQAVTIEFSPTPELFRVPENLITARVNQLHGTVTIKDLELDVLHVD